MLKKQMEKFPYVDTLWFDCLGLPWAVRGVGELTKVFIILGTTKANAAFAECGDALIRRLVLTSRLSSERGLAIYAP